MKNFNIKENRILTEIYRRLNYFHSGDLNHSSLFLGLPSEANLIKKYGIIKPYSKETPRALNWYNLTDKGKEFFKHYIRKVSSETNLQLYDGKIMTCFDKTLIK